MVVALERSKEPDIDDYYNYPINYKGDKLMLVDFPCNPIFNDVFIKNLDRTTKFPKDLYIGLAVRIDEVVYRLFNMTIAFDDIKNIDVEAQLLPIRISNFEINAKEAGKLELIPEKVEALNRGVKANPTMLGLQMLVQSEICERAEIIDSLYLALSSKSIALSQIDSELKNKWLSGSVNTNSLLKDFLDYRSIDNVVDSVETDELIQVTQLDEYQKKAVARALNSRVSVITGPPGTGKTQVIENILANCLIRGKKVLVSSKNNKAVDNVKERFDELDTTGYLVRFGSKKLIGERTKVDIQRIRNEIPRLAKQSDKFYSVMQHYETVVTDIREAKAMLNREQKLSSEVIEMTNDLGRLEASYKLLSPKHEANIADIEKNYMSVEALKALSPEVLDEYLTVMRKHYNLITMKFSGLFGFWYNWFLKRKYAMLTLNLVESMPYQARKCLRTDSIKSSVTEFEDLDDIISCCEAVIGVLEQGIYYHNQIYAENEQYQSNKKSTEKSIASIKQILAPKQIELDDLKKEHSELESVIEENKLWILKNSSKILNSCITHYKLQDQASKKISSYMDYIPDNIPYKDKEYDVFKKRTNDFLSVMRLCAATSLSLKNSFPLSEGLFDVVVVDEASQCDVASALPLIMRAKQLVVIGDPMQLRHISLVKVAEENEIKKDLGIEDKVHVKYAECSLWDYCCGFISSSMNGATEPLMLQCHYRCHPDIIGYSNNIFYSGLMGCALKVKTDISKFKMKQQGIIIVDVKGLQKNDVVNVNELEAVKAIQIATEIAAKNDDVSIGIVTPFKHQAERINYLVPAMYQNRIEVNTVHKYQGDEKDVIIYSLVVTSNSPGNKIRWIDQAVPNLVNVAVTRAKSTLYVVCNTDYIKHHSRRIDPLGNLVRYKN